MGAPDTTAENTAVEASAATAVGPDVLSVGDSHICSGVEPMIIPGDNKHIRDVGIRLPVQFIDDRPAVIAVCHATEGPAAAGLGYVVYQIGVARQGLTHTFVRISAANPTAGQQIDGLFVCNYVVIGKAKT